MPKHVAASAPDVIDGNTSQEVFRRHHAACAPCRELFMLARRDNNREVLNAWRKQVTIHIANEVEQREFERQVIRHLAAYRTVCEEKDGDGVTDPVPSPGHPGDLGRRAGSRGDR